MIWQARTLGAPLTVPPGSREQCVERVLVVAQPSDDVGHDVHHMAVEFDRIAVGHADAARRRGAADIVAPRSSSIRCSARSLGSASRLSRLAASSARVLPRGRVPAIGRIVTSPAHADEDLGARPDQRKARQVEMIEEGRGLIRRRRDSSKGGSAKGAEKRCASTT
jgi:hypothetical protein